jgi:aldehyde dehydrogenase (NAD+)
MNAKPQQHQFLVDADKKHFIGGRLRPSQSGEMIETRNPSTGAVPAQLARGDIGTMSKMIHGIQAGQVWVNCYGAVDIAVGFGGYKHSGYGWKGGAQHVEGFLYQKAVTINGD